MVAATPLANARVPDRLSACNDRAGLPGHCCLCGRRAPTQLCRRCFATHADEDGTLPGWVLVLRREATRQAVAAYRARRAGFSEQAAGDLLARLARCPVPAAPAPPRRLHRRGTPAVVAPQVTEFVAGPAALAALRRYSPSGVPLDMPAFLALLGDLCGWPPPGTLVDQRHREALIDLYERVYEA